MYCNDCGQALVAGQGFCPRCGHANAAGAGYQGPGGYQPRGYARRFAPLALVERRVNALAVGWLVYAGLAALFGFAGLAFARAALEGQPWMHGQFGPWHSPWHSGPVLPLFFWKIGWMGLMLRVGFAAAAGFGLMQKAPWGRWVAIVAAILAMLHFPFGTAIGIWTLVVLLGAQNAAGYDAMAYRAVPRY